MLDPARTAPGGEDVDQLHPAGEIAAGEAGLGGFADRKRRQIELGHRFVDQRGRQGARIAGQPDAEACADDQKHDDRQHIADAPPYLLLPPAVG